MLEPRLPSEEAPPSGDALGHRRLLLWGDFRCRFVFQTEAIWNLSFKSVYAKLVAHGYSSCQRLGAGPP